MDPGVIQIEVVITALERLESERGRNPPVRGADPELVQTCGVRAEGLTENAVPAVVD
jgi:hypothetical protein